MDQNFRRRLQKTLYSGELEPDHSPLALTELAVEYFQDLAPHKLGHVDLQSASIATSQETVSPSSVTMSMMYAKRLQRKRPDYVRKMSSSDLFLISMMMASKYLYDEGVEEEVFNDEWAENAGLEKEEINDMEVDFLNALEWELFIKKDDFEQAMLSVEKRIALQEGLKRGWFSYSDLCLLLDDPTIQLSVSDVGLEWLKVVVVSSAAYFVGVMTMVGSTVLVTNASMALASSGLLPVLLPVLHIAPSVPSSLPFPTSMSPLSMVEFPDPILAGFNLNETGSEEEGAKEEPRAVPETPDLAWNPGKSVVDTIMSQLMAVLTIKSHVAQFVSAVAASSSYRKRCTVQQASFKAGSKEVESDQAASDTMISRWFGMEESATVELDSDTGSCACCEKWKAPSKTVGFVPFAAEFQNCRWWKDATAQQHRLEPGASRDGSGQDGSGLRYGWSNGDVRAQMLQPECCSKEALASMCSLFPDITIGFSTSMPPVYAT